MISEIIKYLIFAIVIVWIISEIIVIIRIIHYKSNRIHLCKLVSLEKFSSKNNVTIKMTIDDNLGNITNIKAEYFTNMRWWLQKIPKIGESFYIIL